MHLAQNYDLLNLAEKPGEIKMDLAVKKKPLSVWYPPQHLILDSLIATREACLLYSHIPKLLWCPLVSDAVCCSETTWAREVTSHIPSSLSSPCIFCLATWEVLRLEVMVLDKQTQHSISTCSPALGEAYHLLSKGQIQQRWFHCLTVIMGASLSDICYEILLSE